MIARRYKAYLMNFEPKWPPVTRASVDAAMAEADFCMEALRGLRVGQTIRIGPVHSDKPNVPRTGVLARVVAVSYHGKLATLEEVADLPFMK